MGGVHASMVSALFPEPVACTPLLAPRSASVAFCDGALREVTAWKPLASREDEKQRVGSFFPENQKCVWGLDSQPSRFQAEEFQSCACIF